MELFNTQVMDNEKFHISDNVIPKTFNNKH